MPTIRQPQPMDEGEVRAMLQAYWRARCPPMPSDLAVMTYDYLPFGHQPWVTAILASRLAPPSTWLRETLSAHS